MKKIYASFETRGIDKDKIYKLKDELIKLTGSSFLKLMTLCIVRDFICSCYQFLYNKYPPVKRVVFG